MATYDAWYRVTPSAEWTRVETWACGGDDFKMQVLGFAVVDVLHREGFPSAEAQVRRRDTGEVVAPDWLLVGGAPPENLIEVDTIEELIALTRKNEA